MSYGSDCHVPPANPPTEDATEHGSLLRRFLQLPEVVEPAERQRRRDPIIDYSKSIIMTSKEYLCAMEEKARLREEAEKDRELKRRESELTKKKKAAERLEKEVSKLQRQQEVAADKAFKERWSATACARARDALHRRIQSGVPPLPGSYVGKFLMWCPPLCRQNQAIAIQRCQAKRAGIRPDPQLQTIPPPWVHQPDLRFFNHDTHEGREDRMESRPGASLGGTSDVHDGLHVGTRVR